MNPEEQWLPTRKLRTRYSTSDRNILRWEREKILPAPIFIGRRKYWKLSDLEAAERAGMARRPKAAKAAEAAGETNSDAA